MYRRQCSRPSPRRNAKRQNVCLKRPYKYLRKEEKLKTKEKKRDTHPVECSIPKNSKER